MLDRKGGLVAPELRKAEIDVDRAHLENKLVGKPFSEAAWYFLASCEEHLFASMFNPVRHANPPSTYESGAHADFIITAAKSPLFWLWKACGDNGDIPTEYRSDMYEAALQLLKLSDDYLAFEAAYTYASIGAIRLSLDGTMIIPDPALRNDVRYEAYDRLVDMGGGKRVGDDVKRLDSEIAASLTLRGKRFSYRLSPRLVRIAVDSMDTSLSPGPTLPAEWQFSRYSLGDFRRWARVLCGLCLIHVIARARAAYQGLPGIGYADSLLIMGRKEIRKRLTRYTGLPQATVKALIEDLTYGAREMRLPDPILQPLVPLLPDRYAIAPNLVLNSSMERNFAVLMNRIPQERAIYSKLSEERESLSRTRIIDAISSLTIRHWYGKITSWTEAPDIDLALMEESSKECLILELKSFVGPAEIREAWDRSKEIAQGISQIRLRRKLANSRLEELHSVLDIDRRWSITWTVASESSVGAAFVQVDDVPVVRTPHLIQKITRNRGLRGIGVWLEERAYLPKEGKHYEVVDVRPKLAGWTIKWHNIRILIDDGYM